MQTYESSGSSMKTFSGSPRRGEMNNRGIYVLPDYRSYDIGFYDLSSFGASPVIRSQSGCGYHGICGFMDEENVVCATRSTGDIYKYYIPNNYEQRIITSNNPSGGRHFHSLLVTQDKHILAAYGGCIYIYSSIGGYIGYSDSLQTTSSMLQMKEARPNIILTAESSYVYSHNINNIGNSIIPNKLLTYSDTHTNYLTIEVLEWNTGNIAIGGFTYPSGNILFYGYVELFHLDEDNSNLQSISNKSWVGMDTNCKIFIIREIQTGIIILGGITPCANICTWEYATTPHKEPTCFPLGGRYIFDIISLS